jgi:hypothetical protein
MIIAARIIAIIIISILFAGCATKASLSISSQPEGAYITEVDTGKPFGMTPISLVYNPDALTQHKNAEGCYLVNGFEARWVSGAMTKISQIKLCGSNYGTYNITFNRNSSQPGLDKDMQFAVQLQMLRAQQRQAQAAEGSATAALWQAWSDGKQNSKTCVTTPVGNSVYTNCR